MIALAHHFGEERHSREADLNRQRWFIKAREDQQKRQDAEERLDDGMVALASDVIMATQAQIQAFTVKLDTYDAATVTALMENQTALDAVRSELQDLLSRAYVMEDGRRVFRTEDGTQVFDEYGIAVTAAELDPDQIDPSHPTWETFQAKSEAERMLEAEQTELLNYQRQLDDTREAIEAGEISTADLDALDSALLNAMPPTVAAYVPGVERTAPETQPAPNVETPSINAVTQPQSANVLTPDI